MGYPDIWKQFDATVAEVGGISRSEWQHTQHGLAYLFIDRKPGI